jgi:FkbM family methyltransferase
MSLLQQNPSVASIQKLACENAKAVAFPPERVLCRVLGTFKMFACSTDYALAPHLAFDGYWESWITSCFCAIVKPGMHVVNVGANVGYYAILAAHLVGPSGKVDAFEPNPVLAAILQDNIELNGFPSFARAHEMAVAETPGRVRFTYLRRSPMNGSMVIDSGDGCIDTNVECVTLDNFFPQAPDLVFVDAEGAEPLIVEGAERCIHDRHPLLVLEWSPLRYKQPKTSALRLMSLGYRAFEVMGDGGERPMSADEFVALDHEITIVCRPVP